MLHRTSILENQQNTHELMQGLPADLHPLPSLLGERLKPYIAALVPKLYRYQYDPNARVRDSMVHIWRALIDNPKKTVDENFDAIATELLKVCKHRLLVHCADNDRKSSFFV